MLENKYMKYVPKKYQAAIKDIYKDIDGYWVELHAEYISTTTQVSTIHEYSLNDIRKQFKTIVKREIKEIEEIEESEQIIEDFTANENGSYTFYVSELYTEVTLTNGKENQAAIFEYEVTYDNQSELLKAIEFDNMVHTSEPTKKSFYESEKTAIKDFDHKKEYGYYTFSDPQNIIEAIEN